MMNRIRSLARWLAGILALASAAEHLRFGSATEYHVAVTGKDANAGTKAAPWRTVQHAADLAQPGDEVTVHQGVYRERVDPPRGGTSDARRIVYQAAQGEVVVLAGSEPANGWQRIVRDTWKLTLPNKFFGNFNPYSELIRGDWFNPLGRQHHTGAVYLNGDWLIEAAAFDDVMAPAATRPLWFAKVGKDDTTIWAQFPGVDPNGVGPNGAKTASVEINVRKTVFTPEKTGVDYITLRGFILRNAATNWAPPTAGQIGLVTACWCKGWIIENNDIAYSRCCGIALGKYSDEFSSSSLPGRTELAKKNTNSPGRDDAYTECVRRAFANGWNETTVGGHVVRNNHIHHCEQAGIVGSMGCAFSTIAGNDIHDIDVLGLFGGARWPASSSTARLTPSSAATISIAAAARRAFGWIGWAKAPASRETCCTTTRAVSAICFWRCSMARSLSTTTCCFPAAARSV